MELFSWVDWVLIIIIVISALISIKKGFVHQLLSLIVLAISFYVAIKFREDIAVFINNIIGDEILTTTYAMSGTFLILFVFMMKVVSKIMFKVNRDGVGIFDRIIGLLYGFVRGVLVCALLIVFSVFSYLTVDDSWKNAKLVGYLNPASSIIKEMIPENIIAAANSSLKQVDDAEYSQLIKKYINNTFDLKLKLNDVKKSSSNTNSRNK